MKYTKENPFKFTAKQKEVIAKISSDAKNSDADSLFYMLSGGVGSGKTICALTIVDLICRNQPSTTALVARRLFSAMATDTFNVLKRDPGILDAKKGKWNNQERSFTYFNGSVIYFRQLENADDLLLGPSYGLIYVEQVELVEENDFRLLRGRLRQFNKNHAYYEQYKAAIEQGQVLKPHNYMILSANPRGCWVKPSIIQNPKTEYHIFDMPTQDNAVNLPVGYINESESETFKKRFYEGKWDSLKGLIYPEFKDANLVTNLFKVDIPKLNNYIALDPGFMTSKFGVLFACVLNDGRLYIYDELAFNGKDVEEDNKVMMPDIARTILQKIGEYKITDYQGIIDSAANSKSEQGPSRTQQLTEAGLSLRAAHKTDEVAGIMRVNSLFRQGKILISAKCTRLLKEIEVYSWKVDRVGNINEKEVPENKSNDLCDCMLYICNELPYAKEQPPELKNYTQQELKNEFYKHLFWGDGEDLTLPPDGRTANSIPGILRHKRTPLDW